MLPVASSIGSWVHFRSMLTHVLKHGFMLVCEKVQQRQLRKEKGVRVDGYEREFRCQEIGTILVHDVFNLHLVAGTSPLKHEDVRHKVGGVLLLDLTKTSMAVSLRATATWKEGALE